MEDITANEDLPEEGITQEKLLKLIRTYAGALACMDTLTMVNRYINLLMEVDGLSEKQAKKELLEIFTKEDLKSLGIYK